jgi:membrane-associated phospholipid phosphatase
MRLHRRARFFVATLVAARSGVLVAQSRLGSERKDFEHFTGDIWSVWTSPARMGRHDIAPTVIAIGGVALTTQVDSAARVWLLNHERSGLLRVLSPMRDSSPTHADRIGTGYYLLPLAGAVYVAGRLSHSPDMRDIGLGCAAGDLSSLGIRFVAYHAVGRGRPRITADPFVISVPQSGGWLWHSFFSGHIANSMACASYLGHRFSFGVAEALPYMYSAAIGVGRMADGEHWASDTVIGGIIGYAIGSAIAARQLARNAESQLSTTTSSSKSRGRDWPVVSWSFQF